MKDGILYCDSCGKLILPTEAEGSRAIVTSANSICPKCAEELDPRRRAALEAKHVADTRAAAKRKASAPSRRSSGHPAEPQKARPGLGRNSIIAISIGIAFLAGILVSVAAFTLMQDETQAPQWAPPAVPAPVVALPVVAPPSAQPESDAELAAVVAEPRDARAAQLLKEAQDLMDPSLGRYDAIMAKLRSVVAEYPDGHPSGEAKTLIADIEARYAHLAESALEAAERVARDSIARGEYDQAASAINSVRARFGDKTWLERAGSARIEAALESVERARADAPDPRQETIPEQRTVERPTPIHEAPSAQDDEDQEGDGDFEIVISEDFEQSVGAFKGGVRVTDNTFNGSAGAIMSNKDTNTNDIFCAAIGTEKGGAGLLQLPENLRVAWAYHIKGAGDITMQFWNKTKAQNYLMELKVPQNTWGIVQAKLADFRTRSDRQKGPEVGDWLGNFNFYAGLNATDVEFTLDDVVFFVGEPAGRGKIARRLALAKAMSAEPEADGYFLSMSVYNRLKEAHDLDKVTPRKIALVGGSLAAGRSIDASLKKLLGGEYSLADKSGLAGAKKGVASFKSSLSGKLRREKPELVWFCFGARDLAQKEGSPTLEPAVAGMIDDALDLGAVPLLTTLASRTPDDNATRELVEELNATILQAAREKNVPCLDLYGILNADTQAREANFKRTGARTMQANETIALSFVKLYRVLEQWVMLRPQPEEKPASVVGAEGVAGDASRSEAASGNLLLNGGFERKDDRTKFAAMWTAHQWGEPGSGFSARLDRSNARSGEQSVVVRGLVDGAQPGIFMTLAVPAGKYGLRFYASTDLDKKAVVRAYFAGRELPARTADETWRLFTHVIVVDERQANASLRLWTSAPRARVWFDDVELVPLTGTP